jgi:hypothetical protein
VGPLVSSTNKTGILLKVALNTIKQTSINSTQENDKLMAFISIKQTSINSTQENDLML